MYDKSVYSILLHRNIPFRSNLLNAWNTKSKIVSTRNHFNRQTGELSSSHNIGDYEYSNVPGFSGNSYPDNNELAIYIHGVWIGQTSAKEQLDRIKPSLNANGYNIPVVGFSWDSNTGINGSGWAIAKFIANQNGLKLAKFISDFKANCPSQGWWVFLKPLPPGDHTIFYNIRVTPTGALTSPGTNPHFADITYQLQVT